MEDFLKKLLYRIAPLMVLLLAACGGGGGAVPGGTVPPVVMVSTLAGTPGVSGSADGVGAAASFEAPTGVTADAAGNIYVADSNNHTIRKITPAGVVTTLAGSPGGVGSADGTGAAARFAGPLGVTADAAGNIYVADSFNKTIRKITPAGVVTTLAGTPGVAGYANGTGAAASFYDPNDVAADAAGNIYVADHFNSNIFYSNIRKITPAGVVTTVAGTPASPHALALDATGNLYVSAADGVIRKITAGVVSTLAGTPGVSGYADGLGAAARFDRPSGVALDAAGNVYVADLGSSTIRKITPAGVVTTLAGKGGESGSADGAAADARFAFPYGIAIDPKGNLYVADELNNTIRKIGPGYYVGGAVSGLTGTLILANSNGDTLTVAADGNFKLKKPVAEGATYSVTVKTNPVGQTCSVTNGSGTATKHVEDIAVTCTTNPGSAVGYTIGGTLSGLAAGAKLELKNSNGDKLTLAANGAFTFLAPVAQGAAGYAVSVSAQPVGQTCTVTSGSGTASADVSNVSVSCAASTYTIGGTVSGLTGTLALQNNGGDSLNLTANAPFTFATPITHGGAYNVTVLTQPTGQTCSVSNITGTSGTAVADVTTLSVSCVANTYTIGGTVSGLTGTLVLQDNNGDDLSLSANGNFTFATKITHGGIYSVTVLTQPAGQTCTVTGGSGTATATVSNVSVSCAASAAVVSTFAGSGAAGSADGQGTAASFDTPFGIASDSAGNLYVAENFGMTIRKITPAGLVSTIAGTAGGLGSADGTGAAASFSFPQGVAVDSAGNLFVADSGNHTIRKVTPAGGVSTMAGTAMVFGSANGTGTAASFLFPGDIAVDAIGNLFVADSGNHTIRKITPAGVVSTFAGTAGVSGSTDATGATARFNAPNGIAMDAAGNLFVADTGNHTVRKITPAGVVSTVAGTAGVSGSTDATGTAAKFNTPFGIAVDSAGNLFVADTYNNMIRKIDTAGVVTTIAGPTTTPSLSSPTSIAVDPAGNLFVADMGNNTVRKIVP